jgi:hypothetical protein
MKVLTRALASLNRRKDRQPDMAQSGQTGALVPGQMPSQTDIALPQTQPAHPRHDDPREHIGMTDTTSEAGAMEIELPAPELAQADTPAPDEPEDAFVLDSSFLDAPYTVIANIDPAEEVIVVQYCVDAAPPEIHVTLAPKGPGDAVELSLNGQPRALVQKANGLTEAHVRTMDVSGIEG